MNCPSRTDDYEYVPGYNQNPSRLAADLTTGQDFNGRVNTTSQRGDRSSGHPSGGCLDDEYQAGHLKDSPSCLSSNVAGWGRWLFSVLCTSFFFSRFNAFDFTHTTSFFTMPAMSTMSTHPIKRSTCASGNKTSKGQYDTPLHVGALFIILFVSTSGCAFPMLVLKFPRLRIPASFLFTARHFGTGVLIATAFVHLLPTAFISLGNPCLSDFWTTDYPAMPGAIALAAIFLLTVIEMVFSPGRNICSGGHGAMEAVSREAGKSPQDDVPSEPKPPTARQGGRPLPTVVDGSLRDMGPLFGRSSSFSRTLVRMGEQSEGLDRDEISQRIDPVAGAKLEDVIDEAGSHHDGFHLSPEQLRKRAVMQCLLLEMGILFHSVFIGMSLSVSVGSEFVILLIAIIFHQTFEGLALGARIASLEWPKDAVQPWVMAFTYGCTTPIGQAIGLATHTLYSPDSEVGLVLVGVMNAISSGLLVFASLVELMSEDFLSDESWRILRGKRRVWACVLVFLGAFLMSLVGAWA